MIVVCVNDKGELRHERSWDEILGMTPEEALTFNRVGSVAMSFQFNYESSMELTAAKKEVEEIIKDDPNVIEHLIEAKGSILAVTLTKKWDNAP